MNADLGSWLNWREIPSAPAADPAAPRLACQCGHDDPAGPCPRLVEDVALPRGGSGQALSWQCGDRIKLAPLETDEDPRALIAGRLWRTPLDDCRDWIPRPDKHDGNADYIQIDNLTRPGSCPSSVAVFFRKQRQSSGILPPVPWSVSERTPRNFNSWRGTWIPRPVVTITVYHDPQDATQANTRHCRRDAGVWKRTTGPGLTSGSTLCRARCPSHVPRHHLTPSATRPGARASRNSSARCSDCSHSLR